MGIMAEYTVEVNIYDNLVDTQVVLDDVERAAAHSLRGKAYSWAVVGFSFIALDWYRLRIYCGGGSENQRSVDEQLKDWPQSIEGLPSNPVLYNSSCSKFEVESYFGRDSRMVDLTH